MLVSVMKTGVMPEMGFKMIVSAQTMFGYVKMIDNVIALCVE